MKVRRLFQDIIDRKNCENHISHEGYLLSLHAGKTKGILKNYVF